MIGLRTARGGRCLAFVILCGWKAVDGGHVVDHGDLDVRCVPLVLDIAFVESLLACSDMSELTQEVEKQMKS